MSSKPKNLHFYIGQVDQYRNNGIIYRDREERLPQRSTRGRYVVCAKNQHDAKELLQEAIQFGSIKVYETYEDQLLKDHMVEEKDRVRGFVAKFDGDKCITDFPKATDPIERTEDNSSEVISRQKRERAITEGEFLAKMAENPEYAKWNLAHYEPEEEKEI